MFLFDLERWWEILSAIRKNKFRTFLTAFGVFWGIFMLIIMLGSGTGLKNGVYRGFGDFATNSVFMWTMSTTESYNGLPRGRWWNFRNADITALRSHIPEIAVLAPRIQAWGGEGSNNVVRGEKTGAFFIYGDYPEWNRIDPVNMLEGRFINQADIDLKRKVAVIGTRVRDMLFNHGEQVTGEYIRIQNVYFKIIGVFEPRSTDVNFGGDKAQSIHLPFTTLQHVYNYRDVVGWFALTAKPDVKVSEVEQKAISLLKRRHNIAPHDKQAVGSFNMEEQYNKMQGLFTGINVLIWIVGIGTLFAGVIGISNIMLVVVKERTREIGIQRAIGASPLKITSQIIMESVFLTIIAGYFGLVAGVGLVELIHFALAQSGNESQMFYNPEIHFATALKSLFILVVAGALAGLIPARKAVSIKPIDALRHE
ncbi:MAG TPA: ABC transporter permease [Bacteroidales bacterium]|nr:ABC transporter permease [Bacteroidales bacterium]